MLCENIFFKKEAIKYLSFPIFGWFHSKTDTLLAYYVKCSSVKFFSSCLLYYQIDLKTK